MTPPLSASAPAQHHVSITPLLRRLWPDPQKEKITAIEIAYAISHVFSDSLSPVQTGALLTALHFTGLDQDAEVIARCATEMREAASPVDLHALAQVTKRRGRRRGTYNGGLCDIVGTGGDSHCTFNVSTTSAIIASSLLLIAKHGNRASTSKSGSADVLSHMRPDQPQISAITPSTISQNYEHTNFAFLYAPVFHPGMKHVATVRKELGWRTIFNLLGPLANPVEALIEARVVGVARRDLGQTFAEALILGGARKGMVVCGAEDLDEISCAGETFCWRLVEKLSQAAKEADEEDGEDGETQKTTVEIDHFTLRPADFGLPAHALTDVAPGRGPEENAITLGKMLRNELATDDAILHFVLLNAAALFVIAGVCEDGTGEDLVGGDVATERGPGGGRWKEGVRLARWAIEKGVALKEWNAFVKSTNGFTA